MQVGASAWIGGRTDVLAAFFLTAFLVLHLRHLQEGKLAQLVGAALALLLAALSKEQALAILPIIPASVLLLRSKNWKELRPYALPFGAVILVFAVLWTIGGPRVLTVRDPIPVMVLNLLRTTSHYGLAFLVPNPSSLITFTLQPYQGFVWVPIGALLIAGIVMGTRQVWKTQPEMAWLVIAALLVYLPVCNFPSVPSLTVAPYRCALVGVPVACIAGWFLLKTAEHRQFVWTALLSINLGWGSWVSWCGVHQWLDSDAFFHSVAQNDPHFVTAVEFDARRLDAQGNTAEAMRITNNTLQWLFGGDQWAEFIQQNGEQSLTPEVRMRLKSTTGIVNVPALGILLADHAKYLAKLRQMPRAALVAGDALIFTPKEPYIHLLYAKLILRQNRAEGIHQLEEALRLDPGLDEGGIALAHQRFLDHRYAEAAQLFEPALKHQRENGYAWFELAQSKFELHDTTGAATALISAESAKQHPTHDVLNQFRLKLENRNHSQR